MLLQSQKKYPYNLVALDFRSPNVKMIDEHVDILVQEINRVTEFNIKTNKDKFQNSEWYLNALYFASNPIRYIFDGFTDHGFDINSPELIQQEIDEGRIKPLLLLRRQSLFIPF